MMISVSSALFLPRSGSALRLAAATLTGVGILTGLSASNAKSAEPPQVVAERGVERFALLCLAHMGQPEGTAAAARQAGLASLSSDALRRYDATQGWSTTVGDRRASILLHPDGNCSLLIDSLPLPFAFKAVEGKLSALSAGERLRGGKIGRDYALRYRNLPAMVSIVGSPGNESGEVSLKTLASDLPGQRASLPPTPPTVVTPTVAPPSTPLVTAPTAGAIVPPVTAPTVTTPASPVPTTAGAPATPPSANLVTPAPFPPVATTPSSAPSQLSAPPALSSSTSTPKVEAGSPPAPFPAPGNSVPVSQMPTTQPGGPSSVAINPPATSVSTSVPVNPPPTSPVPSSSAPHVAEAPVPNIPLFPTAPTTPSLSPDLLPPAPSVAATPLTPVDPDKPIAEASLVALFADACLTTKGSYAALQAKADAQGWRAMLPAAARDGFDFSWLIVPGKGVKLGLFLDSLRQKCCVSAFPADPSLIRQAIDARLTLGTPTSQVSKLKEVYVYPTKNGLTVSADFERTEPSAVFANVCSRPKLP